jgi:hypothetical protein
LKYFIKIHVLRLSFGLKCTRSPARLTARVQLSHKTLIQGNKQIASQSGTLCCSNTDAISVETPFYDDDNYMPCYNMSCQTTVTTVSGNVFDYSWFNNSLEAITQARSSTRVEVFSYDTEGYAHQDLTCGCMLEEEFIRVLQLRAERKS